MIKTVSFDLKLRPNCRGIAFDKAVRQGFYSAMEEVDALLSGYAQHLRIDRIDLDLGLLPAGDLEKALKDRLVQTLGERSAIIFQQMAADPPAFNNRPAEIDTLVRPAPHRAVEAFLHFLQTAYLPWWADRIDEEEVLEESRQYAGLQQAFGHCMRVSAWAMPRLLRQFSTNFLERFAIILLSQHHQEVWMAQLLRQVSAVEKKLSGTSMRTAIAHELRRAQFRIIASRSQEEGEEAFLELVRLLSDLMTAEDYDEVRILLSAASIPASRSGPALPESQQPGTAARTEAKPLLPEKPAASIPPHQLTLRNASPAMPGEETTAEIFIQNAGLVILHPFLPVLFSHLNYLTEDGGGFSGPEKQERAVALLSFLAVAEAELPEYGTPLCKLLCGVPLAQSIQRKVDLSDREISEAGDVLRSVIRHWPVLKDTDPAGLREAFLARTGKLTIKKDSYLLQVEQKAMDVLLTHLAWGIGIIRLPWMPSLLHVEWI